ncbi:DoxX family membrane protein [Roseicyclus marinus]|uniref:DoxX family membrane protein n=1 Tax=Roseicyclus marinus TaxID=2161673 RepID=UPI00240F62B6|nr:DoxX family membrane protein [Roseicyclus marinus]MDG3041984.1 DoxX family membrane protein [Roseicyclus marinus]
MHSLIALHSRIFGALETHVAPALLPTLARFLFVAALFLYYWNSGLTKVGEGLTGLFRLDLGAYFQILPRAVEAVGYDPSALGPLARAVVLAGTWAEFLLPILLLVGLFTRLAALGMTGFIMVQTWVDVMGHGVALGQWFDRHSDGLIDIRAFWVFPLIVLVLKGAGPLSLDAWLSRRQTPSAALTPVSQPR